MAAMAASKKPAKMGRPTKYKPEYCDKVEQHLAQGFSLASWAHVPGVCRETLFEWAGEHQDFFHAIKRGRAAGMELWEQRLANQAKKSKGNTAAIIFAMKNLYKDDWMDRIIQETTGKDGGPVEIKLPDIAGKVL